MDHVACIEKLGDGGVNVLLRLVKCIRTIHDPRLVLIVEVQVLATIWAVVVEPAISAFPILMREDLYLCQM